MKPGGTQMKIVNIVSHANQFSKTGEPCTVQDFDPAEGYDTYTKFIYWPGQLMLLGNGFFQHKQLVNFAKNAGIVIPEELPSAAGCILRDGTIERWGSYGYNLGDPGDLRSEIIDLLHIKE